MRTYQYNDTKPPIPEGDTGTTKWIAAPTEEVADAEALLRGWDKCGGEVWDEARTQEMIDSDLGGLDVIIR